MRLICPNCDAQYEVDASAIPPEGRDVQCSNCAHTWFQAPQGPILSDSSPKGDAGAEVTHHSTDWDDVDPTALEETEAGPVAWADEDSGDDIAAHAGPEPETWAGEVAPHDDDPQDQGPVDDAAAAMDGAAPEDGPETMPEDEEAPATVAADDAAGEQDDDALEATLSKVLGDTGDSDDDDAPSGVLAAMQAPSTKLESSLKDMLREEAALETQARKRDLEDRGLESQPELGLDETPSKRSRLQEKMAKLRGEAERDDSGDDPVGSRRDLLPDIEEINSTLRATTERRGAMQDEYILESDSDAEIAPSGRGFTRGFMSVSLIAVLALLLYLVAPGLSARVPAAQPVLQTYVATIDKARLALDDQMRALVERMTDSETPQ